MNWFAPKDDIPFGFVFWWWIGGMLLYVVGAVVYAMKIPERWSHKTFDYIGHSH